MQTRVNQISDILLPEFRFYGNIYLSGGNNFTIAPRKEFRSQNLNSSLWYLIFPLLEKNYLTFSGSATSINPSGTGIGASVDGLPYSTGLQESELVWAFFDASYNFLGFGCTRKPHTTFTAVVNGTRGSTGTFTVNTGEGFQFVNGARVIVRNTNGSAPYYEYNQGTITSVSDTSIDVLLDNNTVPGESYGTDISGTTNGEIVQLDNLVPNVVTTGSQTPYAPNYCLIGEVSKGVNDNINSCYRADDPFRFMDQDGITAFSVTGAFNNFINFARYVPIQTPQVNCTVSANPDSGSVNFTKIVNTDMFSQFELEKGVNIVDGTTAFLSLGVNTNLTAIITGTSAMTVTLLAYYIPGGTLL